jgi:hypothetical protein
VAAVRDGTPGRTVTPDPISYPPGKQASNALTVARLTKAFASQVVVAESSGSLSSTSMSTREDRIVGAVTHTGGPRASSKTKDNLMQRTTRAPLSLQMARRCGAKAQIGKPCQSPVVQGRKRCRMHGGAHGSGAPSGERNGNYRHGLYTAEAIAERKATRAWLRSLRRF